MDFSLLAQSLALGVAVAAPVGPMSLLCIQRTLAGGQPRGLVFGAGIAAADGSYAAIAALGLTAISASLISATPWIKVAGAALLAVVGVKIMFARPASSPPPAAGRSYANAFVLAYMLTLMNPPTLLFFIGIFATLATLASVQNAVVFAAGIFAGSALWWVILTTLISRAASLLTDRVRAWINRVSGAVLIGFAFYGVA